MIDGNLEPQDFYMFVVVTGLTSVSSARNFRASFVDFARLFFALGGYVDPVSRDLFPKSDAADT